jgi:hypothetical protein
MSDEDTATDEISRIEAQLDELAEVSARCRKIMLGSKAAIIGGAALLMLMMLGLLGSNPVAAIGSIAVVLVGIVSLGANASTLDQTMAAMNAAEALRSDLISKLELRTVGDGKL